MNDRTRFARIETFALQPGRVLAGRYEVNELLGAGWEGEVYAVTECRTSIPRAAKIFFPQRNVKDRTLRAYAKKLDRLRDCPIIIQYHHSEEFSFRGRKVTALISDLVKGELLEDFVRRQPGRRLHPFEALHLVHAITVGVEQIHNMGEFHGDLHDRNVIVRRHGLGFAVKLLDFYDWGGPRRQKRAHDVVDLVRLLYDATGGRTRYPRLPSEIKGICLGLRSDLVRRKFPNATRLRTHLESLDWSR
jgi:hypothetical protein